MFTNQVVTNPFGITVFGSSAIKVDPDMVSVDFAVSRTEKHPKDSFKLVREASQSVNTYLQQVSFKKDLNSSRITLSKAWDFSNKGREFTGYIAQVDFHVLLYDLDQLENLLVNLVDAGVNEINSVNFEASKLKEIRAEARRHAVVAAREKAENYCLAASVKLGQVVHIEDVNPDTLPSRYSHREMGRGSVEDENTQAFSPGKITINAAVLVSFRFADK